MKQHFTERAHRTVWSQLRASLQDGRLQLGVGLVCIIALAVAGAAGVLWDETLNQGTPSEAYQPPHNLVLQRLLYHPANRLAPVERGMGSDPFQLSTLSSSPAAAFSSQPSDSAAVRITSRPPYTAVVGEEYRYVINTQPGLAEASAQASTISLDSGPVGMRVTAPNTLTWTPQPDQQGRQTVDVLVLSPDGEGMKQTFTVHVSETPHPLGTERRGRGMGAALLLGARWALLPGTVAVLISMLLGVLVGGLAGYYEGRTDTVLSYSSRLTEAFPALVALFLAAVIFAYNIFWIMAVVGVIGAPRVAQAIKAKVQSLKARQFVEASRELGLHDREILWRDIIWYNARPQLLLQASYGFVFAIIVEVTLSYLKLGIQAPAVSWGNLLLEGKETMVVNQAYWPVVLPSLAIILSIAAFYLVADGVARYYDIDRT